MKVSIIIPVFEVTAYIQRCIKSVMNQTYENIECVIVDDATQDDSIAKCEQLIEDYEGPVEFRILHHQNNRGLSAARNTGLNAAAGNYVYFLDGDDEIAPDCIEKLIRPVLNDTTIEMVKGVAWRKDEDGSISPSIPGFRQQEMDIVSLEAVRDYFFRNNLSVAAWNKLIRRDFLNQHQLYFKEGVLFEDTLWTFFVVKYLSHIYTIPDVTYYYHKRPNSITTGTSKKEKAYYWGLVYEEIANNFTHGESGREAKYYVRDFYRRCAASLDSPSFARGASLFKKALSGEQYKTERVILSITVILSKTAFGRYLFPFFLKLISFIKRL